MRPYERDEFTPGPGKHPVITARRDVRAHRGARLALALTGAKSSAELAMIAAAAGLASNIAALRALATEGIQKGHMALHHRATSPGAEAKGPTMAAGAEGRTGHGERDAARAHQGS